MADKITSTKDLGIDKDVKDDVKLDNDGFSNEVTAGEPSQPLLDSKGKEVTAEELEARRVAGTL